MINRPATRIELKLEDDICEYEEICEMRRNNTEMQQNLRENNNIHEDSPYNSLQSGLSNQHQNILKNNLYINNSNFNKRINEEDSHSKSSDISMK